MTVALVQSKGAASTASVDTISVTLDTAPTAGSLLVAVGGADATMTGPSGWTLAESAVDFTGLYLWYKVAGSGDSATVTAGVNATRCAQLAVMEYSGLLTSSPLDVTASNTPGGTGQKSVTTGTTDTTAQADELAIAACGQFGIPNAAQTVTWSEGYMALFGLQSTGSTTNNALWVATATLAEIGAQSATCTFGGTTSHPGALIATFKVEADTGTETTRGVMTPGAVAGATMTPGTTRATATMTPGASAGATMTGGAP